MRNKNNNLLKGGYAGLLIALLAFFSGIEGRMTSPALTKMLEQAQAEAPTRSVAQPMGTGAQVPADTDKYVQSEAHLQVPAVKEALAKIDLYYTGGVKDPRTPNELVTPFMNIVAAVINKEVELKNSHYVFYNGAGSEWRVPQDIYKQLYAYRNPLQSVKDFVFVRFSDASSIHAQDFLQENVAEWGGVNDNIQEVRDVLVSTNLALFGGVGTQGECTWNYFLTAKSHRWPTALQYYQILKANDISYDIEALAKEAQIITEKLAKATPEQMLLQYCIPQDKVDATAYLAWILGVPYNPKSAAASSVELMEKWMEGKERVGAVTGPIVKKVMKNLRKGATPEYAQMHEELKAAVENGDFGISAFMDEYRNAPWAIKNVNEIQARVLITKDIIQNPGSGVKIFSYFTTPQKDQEEYLQSLNALVKKIIDQENSKTPEQKVADIAKNEEIFERLDAEEKAARQKEKVEKKAKKVVEKPVAQKK